MADPKIGPADPATRRRLIEKHIQDGIRETHNDRKAAETPYVPSVPKTGAHPELRRGPQGKTIMESVDSAVRGDELHRKCKAADGSC